MRGAWRDIALGLILGALATGAPAQEQGGPVTTSLTLFAGTAQGPWRSRDWGGSWERVARRASAGQDPQDIGAALAWLPVGPRVYLGGTGGLYISEDFGETWEHTPVEGPVLSVLPSRYPEAEPTVFLGTPRGLLKSVDAGRSFRPTVVEQTPVHCIAWPGPALIVATGRGVLVSEDGGSSFSAPGAGLPAGEVRALALSSFFAVDPVILVGVGTAGVHRSPDGGRTWVAAGLSGKAVTDLVWLGPFLYAVTAAGLLRSQDLGVEWIRLGDGLAEAQPLRILFPLAPESGAQAFLATDRGVYRTGDGGAHWELVGFGGEQVLSVATFPPPSRMRDPRRSR